MRVAALQFDVLRGAVEENLASAEEGLRAAAEAGVALVLLPEMWATSFVADGEDAAWLARSEEAWECLRARSAELGVAVAGSAYATGGPDERLRNRLRLYAEGRELLAYDKVHLFTPTAEHLGFSRGTAPPPTVDWRGWRVSGVVCYDLRFASLLRAPFLDGAELLLVPAQWPTPRAAHWRALVLGRAVEHQAYVLAANRTGRERVGRRGLELEFPGNSLVASPHGEVLAEGRGTPGLVQAEVDSGVLRQLRERVPVRQDERVPERSPRPHP